MLKKREKQLAHWTQATHPLSDGGKAVSFEVCTSSFVMTSPVSGDLFMTFAFSSLKVWVGVFITL